MSTATAPSLPATLRLGAVHLTVTDLHRSISFYEEAIGLALHRRDERGAALGAGREDLLVLVEEPEARPAGRHAGLYHFALLHHSRHELARAAHRLLDPIRAHGTGTQTPITGASDHGISEAIYLPDPDGNGIELAADQPRDRWPDLSDPSVSAPRPLDMGELLALVDGEHTQLRADPALVVGHLHLHVGDLERALGFYRDVIGFGVVTGFPSAAFLAAGDYHHHLGVNTWRGEGVPAVPDGTVGLRHWTVVLDDVDQVEAVRARVEGAGVEHAVHDGGFVVRDPWGSAVVFSAA